MNMAKKVTHTWFETEDGKKFDTLAEAENTKMILWLKY